METKKSNLDLALLLVRIALGLVFFAYGWEKVADMDGTVGYFSSLGMPAFMAYVVSYVELLGGVAMILGIFTGWAGLLLAINMAGAMALVNLERGFIRGYDFDLVLFLCSLGVALAGPGIYTILRFKKRD